MIGIAEAYDNEFEERDFCGCRPFARTVGDPRLLAPPELDDLVASGRFMRLADYAATVIDLLDMLDADEAALRLNEDVRAAELPEHIRAEYRTRAAAKRAADSACGEMQSRKLIERDVFDELLGRERLVDLYNGDSNLVDAQITVRYAAFNAQYAGVRGTEARGTLHEVLRSYLSGAILSGS